MLKIGITGGIGSGKSTVCRLFAAHGIPCYDCDSAAKRLMAEDAALRERIIDRFGSESYTAEGPNRPWLAAKVFGDEAARAALNGLVHPAVIADFERWAAQQQSPYVVLESAILYESGLESHLDRVVAVLAPERLRLERAMRRDGADADAIRRRMAAQPDDDTLRERADCTLVNIREEELAADVARLDRLFRHAARN